MGSRNDEGPAGSAVPGEDVVDVGNGPFAVPPAGGPPLPPVEPPVPSPPLIVVVAVAAPPPGAAPKEVAEGLPPAAAAGPTALVVEWFLAPVGPAGDPTVEVVPADPAAA